MRNSVKLLLMFVRRGDVEVPDDTTPPDFLSGEEGDVTNLIVVIVFDEDIVSPTADYLTGVTIKINTVTVDIDTAVLQGDGATVYYTIASGQEADANDDITWEYSDTLGDIEDLAGNQLEDVNATTVENNVGEHLRFDHQANSMQLVTLGF